MAFKKKKYFLKVKLRTIIGLKPTIFLREFTLIRERERSLAMFQNSSYSRNRKTEIDLHQLKKKQKNKLK